MKGERITVGWEEAVEAWRVRWERFEDGGVPVDGTAIDGSVLNSLFPVQGKVDGSEILIKRYRDKI
jgi:hypothetical protein